MSPKIDRQSQMMASVSSISAGGHQSQGHQCLYVATVQFLSECLHNKKLFPELKNKNLHDLEKAFKKMLDVYGELNSNLGGSYSDAAEVIKLANQLNKGLSYSINHKVRMNPIFSLVSLDKMLAGLGEKDRVLVAQRAQFLNELKQVESRFFIQKIENDFIVSDDSSSVKNSYPELKKEQIDSIVYAAKNLYSCSLSIIENNNDILEKNLELNETIREICTHDGLTDHAQKLLEKLNVSLDKSYSENSKPSQNLLLAAEINSLNCKAIIDLVSIFGRCHVELTSLLSYTAASEVFFLCNDINCLCDYISQQKGVMRQDITDQCLIPLLNNLFERLNKISLDVLTNYCSLGSVVLPEKNNQSSLNEIFVLLVKFFFNAPNALDSLTKSIKASKVELNDLNEDAKFKKNFFYYLVPKKFLCESDKLELDDGQAIIFRELLEQLCIEKFIRHDSIEESFSLNSSASNSIQIEDSSDMAPVQVPQGKSSVDSLKDEQSLKSLHKLYLRVCDALSDAEYHLKEINHFENNLFLNFPTHVLTTLNSLIKRIAQVDNTFNSSTKIARLIQFQSGQPKLLDEFNSKLNELMVFNQKLLAFKDRFENKQFYIDLCKLYSNPSANIASELLRENQIESVVRSKTIFAEKDVILEYQIQYKPLEYFKDKAGDLKPFWLHVHVSKEDYDLHKTRINNKFVPAEFIIVAHLKNDEQKSFGKKWEDFQREQKFFFDAVVKRSFVGKDLYNQFFSLKK